MLLKGCFKYFYVSTVDLWLSAFTLTDTSKNLLFQKRVNEVDWICIFPFLWDISWHSVYGIKISLDTLQHIDENT